VTATGAGADSTRDWTSRSRTIRTPFPPRPRLIGEALIRPSRTASRTWVSDAPVSTAASSAVTHSGMVGTEELMWVIKIGRKL
jgi:hypothetical protein